MFDDKIQYFLFIIDNDNNNETILCKIENWF